IDPRAINYVEVAANGSPMGDPIEIVALNNAFKTYGDERNYCALGAVKSNVGHLEAASGMSQLSKVLYQMKHRCLAPSINAEPLNPKINLKDSCFYVQKELAEWKRPSVMRDGRLIEFPRTAAITAIGAGGSNAHLIVQEYERTAESQPVQGEHLIVLSARNAKGLKAYAEALAAFLSNETSARAQDKPDENKLAGKLRQDLLAAMARLLAVDPAEIGVDQEFVDYGCDEIVLNRLCREINRHYGLHSIPSDWSENRTLANCARHLLEKNHEVFAVHYGADTGGRSGDGTADLSALALSDIAYTLQVGREAMRERLAIVVSGKRELVEKLEQYSSGQSDDVMQGSVANSSPLAKMLGDSAEGNDFVGKILAGGNLHEIAQLWVSGIEIDWERLYAGGRKPQRKPLPTYPFARDSYWIKLENQGVVGRVSTRQASPEFIEVSVLKTDQQANGLSGLKEELIACVAKLLKVDADELDADTDLQEYGFDSINLAGFAAALNTKYKLELTADLFLAYPTVSSCAAFLLKTYRDVFAAHYGANARSVEHTPAQQHGSNLAQFPREVEPIVFEKSPVRAYEPVAIIGVSGMMPGSDDLDEFWENLKSGRNLIGAMPAGRWDWQGYYGEQQAAAQDLLWGGFLNNVDKFDNLFFALSPKEAELMDPQQRLFLQTVWSTIENAGYAVSDLAGSNTGLFVGVSCHDYEQALHKTRVKIEAHTSTSLMVHSILANRLSYLLDFHGPSEIVDTACSSSIVAVHRAIRAIHSGDCDLAIAGGVNVLIDPQGFLTLNEAGILSASRDVKLFHQDGKGYLRGEGVGAVLLKPLSKAVADRDHIYAVIKGSDVNHDGKSFSLTSPNPVAQARVVKNAYVRADIDPSTIGYIEAQGTGSPMGDPVEINAFKNAFQELYRERGIEPNGTPHCGIGYLKPSIGHLESAYGIGALIKVLLAMENRMLPASRNISAEGSGALLKNSPFYMVRENRSWEQLADRHGELQPRRAGIHAFGVGGVNAHIVLEEYRA
ncbi:MAG TPA: beta-ketoacyl synthase N-terminal-like domain-containing protein, partial [Gallionella sp.]|nr:beta-ketoacyl synthase N-terminal-like domain-containing protein [Gallionella sp.]